MHVCGHLIYERGAWQISERNIFSVMNPRETRDLNAKGEIINF